MPATMSATANARAVVPVAAPARVDRTLVGIGLIVASGVVFSCADALSKLLAETLPAVEVTWFRWLGLIVVSLPVLVASRGGVLHSNAPGLQVFRALCLTGSSILFTTGLMYLPLASATTINFVSPLIVTALSIVILGETVGLRRWAAVLVGLVGVVIVVRPGSGTFGPAAALPILSAACWAGGIVATRRLGGIDGPWTAMCYGALIGFAILSVALAPIFVPLTPREMGLAAAMAAFATAGQFLSLYGYRLGPASVLVPFTYLMLVWTTGLGYAIFGNVPDFWTWVGAAVIIASGVYTAHRERVRAREAALKAAGVGRQG